MAAAVALVAALGSRARADDDARTIGNLYVGLSLDAEALRGGDPSPGSATIGALSFGARYHWFALDVGLGLASYGGHLSSDASAGERAFTIPMDLRVYVARRGKLDIYGDLGWHLVLANGLAQSYVAGAGFDYWLGDHWTVGMRALADYLGWEPDYFVPSTHATGVAVGVTLTVHLVPSGGGNVVYVYY